MSSTLKKHIADTIRQLIPFLDFVKDHPATSNEHRANAAEVVEIIQNIETYGNSRNWCICFSPYSEERLFSPTEGLYRYDWWVFMESDTFSVESEKRFYPFAPATVDFFFHYSYNFELDTEYNDDGNDLSPFINDAFNYQHYMTAGLQDVETEIEIY